MKENRIPFVNNLIVFVFFAILVFTLKDKNTGYKWVAENLIDGNLKTIKKHKDLSFEQRQEGKLGFNATYLNFINENTPDTAVILMPPDSVILHQNGRYKFNKYLKNKSWCSYLVYPRKLVYEREKTSAPLYNKVTHVAIINGWGYDKLGYKVNKRVPLTVLPIKD